MHGKLKSSNCIIDGRWTCKLCDYGLFYFRSGAAEDPEMSDFKRYSSKDLTFIILTLLLLHLG